MILKHISFAAFLIISCYRREQHQPQQDNCYFWACFGSRISLMNPTYMPEFLFRRLMLIASFSIICLSTGITQNLWVEETEREKNWVDSVYASLSLEERIAQLMMVRANQPGQPYDSRMETWIRNHNIGGVTFFKGKAGEQLIQTNRWQQIAKTPLLVSIDAEWGLAMRIESTVQYPLQMALGAVADNNLIYEMGRQIGEQCARMGIHMNFAPVVDVNNNPANPVIGLRAFGENPDMVSEKGWAYASGLQDQGIITTAKHYPGHGDTQTDSHYTLPVVDHDPEHLSKVELKPFNHLINKGVSGIMVAHVNFPAFEPKKDIAASLSKNVVTGLLREQSGFNGLIVTDGLDMKGVTDYHPSGAIELLALMAGNDILLLPANVTLAIRTIADAALNDPLVSARVEESCRKVLQYKFRAGLHTYRPAFTENLNRDLNKKEYKELAYKLFEESMTLLINHDETIPFANSQAQKVATLSVGGNRSTGFQNALAEMGLRADHFSIPRNPSAEQIEKIKKDLDPYHHIVVSIQNTNILTQKKYGIDHLIIQFINELTRTKNISLVLFASAYAADYFQPNKGLKSLLVAWQDNPMAEKAAANVLMGKAPSKGTLPVSVGQNWKEGFGLRSAAFQSIPAVKPEININPASGNNNPFGYEKTASVNQSILSRIDSVVVDAIERKAFPGCQIAAMKDGKMIYLKSFGFHTYDKTRPVNDSDLFDVASLTKILASTLAVMKLNEQGKLKLEDPLGKFFPFMAGSDKSGITISEILTHQSGFSDWIPFYEKLISTGRPDTLVLSEKISVTHPIRVAENLYVHRDYHNRIFDTIVHTPLKRKEYRYSDLGMYFVPQIVEQLTNQAFDQYLEQQFYRPMGLKTTTFQPLNRFPKERIVPTELDTVFRKQLIHGDVHDQGAALMGGISGHAGLFSNAADVARIMQMLLDKGVADSLRYFTEQTVEVFTRVRYPNNNNRRALGFDKIPLKSTEKNRMPAKKASAASFGHSGFTGTFAWADPVNKLVFVFLSNRIHPDSKNTTISKLSIRTEIHEILYEATQ